MKKLSIKDIIDFRGKSEKGKKNFAIGLKAAKKEIESEGGGDYWICSLSAISNSFKFNDIQFVINKRHELEIKLGKTDSRRSKIMYKRNIDILYNYEDFDLDGWRPGKKISFLHKDKSRSVIAINDFRIRVTPQHVFTFQKGDIKCIKYRLFSTVIPIPI